MQRTLEELNLQQGQLLEQAAEHRALQQRLALLDADRSRLEAELEQRGDAHPTLEQPLPWRDRLNQMFGGIGADARLSQALDAAPDAADLALAHALDQLRSLEIERRTIVTALAERSHADANLDRVLEQKAELLSATGHRDASAMAAATALLSELRARQQRISENLDRAHYATQLLVQLVEQLRSADLLGDLSVLGLDLLSDPLKHAALSGARSTGERASLAVAELRDSLSALAPAIANALDEKSRLASIVQALERFGPGLVFLDTFMGAARLDIAIGFSINRWFVQARDCLEQVHSASRDLHQLARRVTPELDEAHRRWRSLLCAA